MLGRVDGSLLKGRSKWQHPRPDSIDDISQGRSIVQLHIKYSINRNTATLR